MPSYPLSETPIQNGNLYCSPSCGRGCTFEEFNFALDRVSALTEIMGPGWIPNVWENLGWHYSVLKGKCRVSPNIRDGKIVYYTVYFNTNPQVVADDVDPKKAVQKVILLAKDNIDHAIEDVAALEFEE